MKLIITDGRFGREYHLADIKQGQHLRESDIYKKNLAALPDPKHPEFKPEHIILLFVDDPEIRAALADAGFSIKEVEFQQRDENGDVMDKYFRYVLKLKAYVKMNPLVMYATRNMENKKVKRKLDVNHWGDIDAANLANLDITFHAYQTKFGNIVASINEVWAEGDQSSGPIDSSYFRDKYAGFEDDDEEVPFE